MTAWHRPDVEASAMQHLTAALGPVSARQIVDGLLAKGRRDATAQDQGGAPGQSADQLERVTVFLTAASSAALTRAAEITGDSRTDVINRAIQSYSLLTGEVRDGNRILITPAPKAGEAA